MCVCVCVCVCVGGGGGGGGGGINVEGKNVCIVFFLSLASLGPILCMQYIIL